MIPKELIAARRWVVWKYETRGNDKPTKVPYNAITGARASSTNPADWCDHPTAELASGQYNGVGFVLGDGFAGIDLDEVIKDGELVPAAEKLVNHLASYAEISPSGRGVKIVGRAPPMPGRKKGNFEVYSTGRYFTITGQQIGSQDQLADITKICLSMQRKAKIKAQPVEVPLPCCLGEARAWLDKQDPALSGAGGHNQTFSVACGLYKLWGLQQEDVWALMVDYNDRCEPPWTEEELLHKVDSAEAATANDEKGLFIPAEKKLREKAKLYKQLKTQKVEANGRLANEGVLDHKGRRVPIYFYHELADLPPTKWLVKNHLPDQSLAVVYGKHSCCKSFWAIDLAFSIAHGRPFLGQHAVDPGLVVYVAAEGQRGIYERGNAWLARQRLHPNNENLIVIPTNLDVSDPQDVGLWCGRTLELSKGRKPKLIVVDTLARNFKGDENSTQEMGVFIQGCEALQKTLCCSVLIVHHTGRGNQNGSRGSYRLECDTDTHFYIEKQDGLIRVVNRKQKEADLLEDYWLEPTSVAESIVLLPAKSLAAGDREREMNRILTAFSADEPRSLSQAAESLGVAKSTVHKYVKIARESQPCLIYDTPNGWLLTASGTGV